MLEFFVWLVGEEQVDLALRKSPTEALLQAPRSLFAIKVGMKLGVISSINDFIF